MVDDWLKDERKEMRSNGLLTSIDFVNFCVEHINDELLLNGQRLINTDVLNIPFNITNELQFKLKHLSTRIIHVL